MAGEEGVEGGKMARFLRMHVLHQGTQMGMAAEEGRCLGGVNQGRCKFAGLVDAKL